MDPTISCVPGGSAGLRAEAGRLPRGRRHGGLVGRRRADPVPYETKRRAVGSAPTGGPRFRRGRRVGRLGRGDGGVDPGRRRRQERRDGRHPTRRGAWSRPRRISRIPRSVGTFTQHAAVELEVSPGGAAVAAWTLDSQHGGARRVPRRTTARPAVSGAGRSGSDPRHLPVRARHRPQRRPLGLGRDQAPVGSARRSAARGQMAPPRRSGRPREGLRLPPGDRALGSHGAGSGVQHVAPERLGPVLGRGGPAGRRSVDPAGPPLPARERIRGTCRRRWSGRGDRDVVERQGSCAGDALVAGTRSRPAAHAGEGGRRRRGARCCTQRADCSRMAFVRAGGKRPGRIDPRAERQVVPPGGDQRAPGCGRPPAPRCCRHLAARTGRGHLANREGSRRRLDQLEAVIPQTECRTASTSRTTASSHGSPSQA